MRRLSIALIAAASTIALTQMASAADLPRKAPVYVPPPPVADWSGVYVGLEGGYGRGKQSANGVSPGGCFDCLDAIAHDDLLLLVSPFDFYPDVAIPSVTQRGWLFGGFAGVQKQWGSWVLGIEGDFDGADIKGSATSSAVSNFDRIIMEYGPIEPTHISLTHSVSIDSKIDELGSLRGKVGFVPAPNWLIYGTGGLAFAHVKNTLTDTSSFAERYSGDGKVVQDNGTFSNITSAGTSMFGWAAGAGIDWKWPVDAGSAWVFGVEYLHYGFGDHTITLTDNAGGSFAFTATAKVDTVKGRISYLFSIH
jgi:outer membrane immunogenic protein